MASSGRRRAVLLLVLVAGAAAAAADMAGDRAALLALRDAVGRHLPWDPTAPTPCGGAWRGVGCSPAGDRVTELRLPGKSLRGVMPVGTVGNLTALRTLSLRMNAISGGVPTDIGGCVQLRSLNLSGNQLTGELPEGFFSLALLEKVDLSGNSLTGDVSPEFSRLANLTTLNLERNAFNGTLPGNLTLPKLARFNVSYNGQLGGAVPASLAGMPGSAFLGTALCAAPLAPCANPAPPPPPSSPGDSKGGGKLSRGAIIGIILGAVAVLVVVLTVGFLACFRRRATPGRSTTAAAAAPDVHERTEPITVTVARTDTDAAVKRSHSPPPAMMSGEGNKLVFVGSAPERPYDLDTLLRASAEVIGKGATGTTYRATLDGGEPVLAVKRLREVNLSEREFRDRVAALAALRHDNLPRLLAYFYSSEEKLLVYDFVGAGSLAALLHDATPNGGGGADGGVDLPRWMRSVVQEEWTSEVFDAAIGNETRVEGEMMRLLQLGMECTEHHPDRRPAMAEVEARIERIVEDTCWNADFSSTDGSRSVSA
uniref:Protein kinase domain-containing protein n=1 Tax=Oryza punctata TaxID=4537 RepID=A0A0E0LUU0_ORYPU